MLIRWTDYGKVKEIDTLYQGNLSPNIPNSTPSVIYPRLKFKYDATGNRLEKEYVGHYKDIYLRDPQGNVMAVYRIAKDSLFLTELPMYGEKRLGVMKENRFLMKKPTQNGIATPVIVTASKPPVKTSIYTLGKKHYETTDWLGNVRVTYTDKKSWQQNKFALNVSSSQDYYPFGSVMEGRNLEIINYRFGYGGHETIDEVTGSGNTIDMGDRWLDVRLGRTIKLDRRKDFYPEICSYVYVGNNPNWFTDPDGNIIVDPQTGKPVVKVNGEWKSIEKVSKDGIITYGSVSDKFNTQTKPYLDILEKSEVGRKNIEYMQTIPTLIIIDPSLEDPLPGDASTIVPTGGLTKDGYYKSVDIIPDNDIIKQNADAAGISVEEKITGVFAVEVGHLKPEQITIDQSNGSFAEKYNKLLNDHVRAQISYRKENGIPLDESLFTPLDKFKDKGFKLDPDLQEIRDNLREK